MKLACVQRSSKHGKFCHTFAAVVFFTWNDKQGNPFLSVILKIRSSGMSALHVLHQGRRCLLIAAGLAALFLAVIPCVAMAAENTVERQQRLEDRFMAPCCWVQTVRHHDSEISRQMRAEIKSLIEKGRSDEQITEFFVQKYGERILASPPIVGRGSLAYWLPIGSLLAGAIGLGFVIRNWHHKRTTATAAPPQLPPTYNSQIDKEIAAFEAHD